MDVEKILTTLGAHHLIRLSRITGDYYQIYCPIHADGNERKPSCGVLLHDIYRNGNLYPEGFCHCFSCGYIKMLPEMITDILKSKNISSSGLDWLEENVPGFQAAAAKQSLIPDSLIVKINDANYAAAQQLKKLTQPCESSYVSDEELQKYRYTVDYMYQRKLVDWVIDRYDVGFDPEFHPEGRKNSLACITFPVRDAQGRTLFFCRRSIEGKFYHYPKYVTKPVYGLYELPKSATSICIMESCINALTAVSWGYNSVALMGTGNTTQLKQLKKLGAREFILCFDGDDAGLKATKKLKRELSSVAIVWIVHMPQGKDVNDLTKEEFDALYESRELQ